MQAFHFFRADFPETFDGIYQTKGVIDVIPDTSDQFVVFGRGKVMHLPSNIKGKKNWWF